MNGTHTHTHARTQNTTLHHFERVVIYFYFQSRKKKKNRKRAPKCRYKIRNIIIIPLKCVFAAHVYVSHIRHRGLLCVASLHVFVCQYCSLCRVAIANQTSYDLVSIIKLTNSDAFINNNSSSNRKRCRSHLFPIHSYRNAEALDDLYFHRKFKLGKELKGKLHFLSMHFFPRQFVVQIEKFTSRLPSTMPKWMLGKTESHHFYYFSVDIK